MKKFTILFVALFAGALSFTNCDRDNDDNESSPIPVEKTCYVNKIIENNDVLNIQYNSDFTIESIVYENDPEYITRVSYDDRGLITTFRYYENNVLTDYDSLIYSTKHLLLEIQSNFISSKSVNPIRRILHGNNQSRDTTIMYTKTIYTYEEERLIKISYYNDEDYIDQYIEVETDGVGNITKASYYQQNRGGKFSVNSISNYEYDQNNHPLSSWRIPYLDESHINNITHETIQYYGPNGELYDYYDYTYTLDLNENNYPIKITGEEHLEPNAEITELEYLCEE